MWSPKLIDGAWTLRKIAVESLALRKVWTTPGGAGERSRPGGGRSQVRPERELELALEEVERVGVPAMDVRVGANLARARSGTT